MAFAGLCLFCRLSLACPSGAVSLQGMRVKVTERVKNVPIIVTGLGEQICLSMDLFVQEANTSQTAHACKDSSPTLRPLYSRVGATYQTWMSACPARQDRSSQPLGLLNVSRAPRVTLRFLKRKPSVTGVSPGSDW